jgi:hypothetical protein
MQDLPISTTITTPRSGCTSARLSISTERSEEVQVSAGSAAAAAALQAAEGSSHQVDDATLSWLLTLLAESEGESADNMSISERAKAVALVRRDIPQWMGGDLTAEAVYSRSNTKLVRTPHGVPAEARSTELDALRECLLSLGRGVRGNSGRCHSHRRTINSTKTVIRCGEEVSVVHVYEVLPPIKSKLIPLYQMGPKAVLGEYVDGVLVDRPSADRDPALLEEARGVLPQSSTGSIDLEQAWAVLTQLSLDGTLLLDDGSQSTSATPMDEALRRATLHRLAAGQERFSVADFRRVVCNLYGGGSYDGVVEPGPGVDTNWEITRYTFRTLGEHVISWHGLEHFAGPAASNEIKIMVTT